MADTMRIYCECVCVCVCVFVRKSGPARTYEYDILHGGAADVLRDYECGTVLYCTGSVRVGLYVLQVQVPTRKRYRSVTVYCRYITGSDHLDCCCMAHVPPSNVGPTVLHSAVAGVALPPDCSIVHIVSCSISSPLLI